ncbi:hypothetical protein ACWFRB_02360 [Rhodococcus sp. NPDC055112]
MRRTTRYLTGLVAAVALISGLTPGIAAAAEPPPSPKTIGPGAGLIFVNEYGRGKCTLGAAGTDAAGRKVGITAGHCRIEEKFDPQDICKAIESDPEKEPWYQPKFWGPAEGVHVLGNEYPVWDWRDILDTTWDASADNFGLLPGRMEAAPIGWIRWVNKGSNDCSLTTTADYMVIEFAPHVQLTSRVTDKFGNGVRSTLGGRPFTINSVHRDPEGRPALPSPILDYVETFGAMSDRKPGTLFPPEETFAQAPSYGMVTGVDDGLIRSYAGFRKGDSGGPAVIRGTGRWVGIITRTDLNNAPFVITSAKNILADLNSRNITGSGFTPVDSDSTAPPENPTCSGSLC